LHFRCIFAGFGGQGIVSMGTLLAYAGMTANRQTTFFPSYGIAMRGGNANCTVIVSDDRIASPVVSDPDIMVVMNDASLNFFQSRVLPGGHLFINTSLINKKADRTDLTPVYVQATQMATEGGDPRMANMAMLGAVMKVTGMLPLDALVQAMHKSLPARLHHLIDQNKRVLELGYASV